MKSGIDFTKVEMEFSKIEFWKDDIGAKNTIDNKFVLDRFENAALDIKTSFFIKAMVNYETCLRLIAKYIPTISCSRAIRL